MKISLFESFLLQLVFYLLIWLSSEYVATLLCILIPIISLAILIITFIVELIDKSKVPKSYYAHMFILMISPILVGIVVIWFYGGNLDWFQDV